VSNIPEQVSPYSVAVIMLSLSTLIESSENKLKSYPKLCSLVCVVFIQHSSDRPTQPGLLLG